MHLSFNFTEAASLQSVGREWGEAIQPQIQRLEYGRMRGRKHWKNSLQTKHLETRPKLMVQWGVVGISSQFTVALKTWWNTIDQPKKKKKARLVIFLSIPIGKAQTRKMIFYLEPQANKMSLVIFTLSSLKHTYYTLTYKYIYLNKMHTLT